MEVAELLFGGLSVVCHVGIAVVVEHVIGVGGELAPVGVSSSDLVGVVLDGQGGQVDVPYGEGFALADVLLEGLIPVRAVHHPALGLGCPAEGFGHSAQAGPAVVVFA